MPTKRLRDCYAEAKTFIERVEAAAATLSLSAELACDWIEDLARRRANQEAATDAPQAVSAPTAKGVH